MTDTVDISKEELKRLAKNEYMKIYMKKRRETDPEFADKQRAVVRKNLQNRYHNDAEYKEKMSNYLKNRYRKINDTYKLVQEMKKTTI